MKDCPFCNINKEKLENTILEETKHFYIMPSLGSLVDGYILIISKRHINSMASLTKEEHSEYQKIIFKYQKIFKSAYHQYPIVFEKIKKINKIKEISNFFSNNISKGLNIPKKIKKI